MSSTGNLTDSTRMAGRTEIGVVEDDVGMLQGIQRFLGACGFRVLPFTSAELVLQSKAASGVGCFVVDIHLPGLSGLELRQRLAERGDTRPVIFITAHEDPLLREAVDRSGAVDCLAKPFSGRRLLAAIDRAIPPASSCVADTRIKEGIRRRCYDDLGPWAVFFARRASW